MVQLYGLLGENISYSQSPQIYTSLWEELGLSDRSFHLLDTKDLVTTLDAIRSNNNWKGLGVTTPYKKEILPFLDHLSPVAQEIEAVNVIGITKERRLIGYNSDTIGFLNSLPTSVQSASSPFALILGTGGAAQSVAWALRKMNIPYLFISRESTPPLTLAYEELTQKVLEKTTLIINATPLGSKKYPFHKPPIPYHWIPRRQPLFYDLSYTPEVTPFLEEGLRLQCPIQNGALMLELQGREAIALWSACSSL